MIPTYRVVKTFRNERDNGLYVLIDCYIPIPNDMNHEGVRMPVACAFDPHMEKSRLALRVALQHGTIDTAEGMVHLRIPVSCQDVRPNPDAPTRQDLERLCQSTLKMYTSLIEKELREQYTFSGMTGGMD